MGRLILNLALLILLTALYHEDTGFEALTLESM